MASYATVDDMIELYGEDYVQRASGVPKGQTPDQAVVDNGVRSAGEIIDTYLSSQYALPLSSVPGVVRTLAIDIAIYRMVPDQGRRTVEMRQRYDDAIALLDKIAAGKVGLGLPLVDSDGNGVPESNKNATRKARILTISRG